MAMRERPRVHAILYTLYCCSANSTALELGQPANASAERPRRTNLRLGSWALGLGAPAVRAETQTQTVTARDREAVAVAPCCCVWAREASSREGCFWPSALCRRASLK